MASSKGIEFWPPVKRQKVASGDDVVLLFSTQNVLTVSVANIEDHDSLIDASGLCASFSKRGITIDVSRDHQNAKIRLSVDSNVSRQGYEIQVDSSCANITAGDRTGLLYAIYTFLQLVHLNGKIVDDSLAIPSVSVFDKPDVESRGLFVPHGVLSLSGSNLEDQLRLLSRLRINELHVHVDFAHESPVQFLSDLVAVSSKFAIDVVPTVVWSSASTSADLGVLKSFSTLPVSLVFAVEGTDASSFHASFAEEVFLALYDLGFKNVFLSSSEWFRNTFDPAIAAGRSGVAVVERDLALAYPAHLMSKPVVCVQDYLNSVQQVAGNQFILFPAGDLKLPSLLRKVGWLIQSGCAWNRNFLLDSLGMGGASRGTLTARSTTFSSNRISFDFSAFKRSFVHLLFDDAPIESNLFRALTGEVVNFEVQSAVANQPVDLRESSVTLQGVVRAEKLLWSLINTSGLVESAETIPSKSEVQLCLQVYNNLLTTSKWNAKVPNFTSEFNEVFSTINLLSSLCKAVIWMHSAWHATSMEASLAISNDQQQHQKRAAVYDNVDTSKPYIAKVYPKSDEIRELLTYVVQQNILFRNYQAEEHISIVSAFECVKTVAGDIVIKQGDPGEYFYIIESGSVDVFMECSGLKIKIGQTLKRGKYFGELALMYNTPRAATVISSEDCVLWRIDRQTYRTIVTHHNKATSAEFVSLISNVHILGKRLGDVLSNNELNKVVSSLEIEEFENNSVIVRQYLTGDYFYIITEGVVDVWQEAADSDTGATSLMGRKVATLTRGNYFGEKALLADDVRQASCVAVGKVTCLSLSREDFIAMLGSWQDLTGGGLRSHADVSVSKGSSKSQMSISLNDLEILSTLGVGAFGKVKLARHKTTLQTFAVKFQSKAFITSQNMQAMIESEARIMSMIDHPCIAKLYSAMQDSKCVYFILELLPGGEFFSYLQVAGKLTEDKARFYSAAVVCAFEEMHRQKIAYRDLKPENMVLDSRGYVKLVDLGLAKQVLSGSTWTMCGTPDYLAPELVLNKGHDYAVDYWALGVLVYEMIHGWPPFFHDNPMKIYEKIISGKVSYPETFSHTLEDIVSKLLTKNPSKRLGNMKGGIADVMKHKWYGSFDWKGLQSGTLAPPYVPDLSNFNMEPSDDNDDEDDMEESDWVAQFVN